MAKICSYFCRQLLIMEKSFKNYIILILLAVIWGSSFILMKRGLVAYDYMQVATLRLFIAFLSLTPFILKAIKVVQRKHILSIVAMAIFVNGMPAFLFTKAQKELDSSVIGILNSLVPLFTLLLGVYFFKTKPTKTNIVGIIIGLCGALILIYSTMGEGIEINNYVFLVISATVMYAVSINVIKKYLYDLDALSITASAFLLIGPLSAIYIFNTDFLEIATTTNQGVIALGYIALLAVVCTSAAVVIFNKLISLSTAIFASSVTYLIPVVAIFWGVFDGEEVALIHLLSVVIILSGVYLVNKKSPTK
ncbi:MAG TPA: DMT family transporter [Flavobacteriales bacterium]|nr:DMT family transporter [Flavobacteriales bacterium]HIK63356.1 DMT family transporter [Flavobacteriales bacterium]